MSNGLASSVTVAGPAAWLAQYRRFWTDSFDRLDGYLETIGKGEQDDAV